MGRTRNTCAHTDTLSHAHAHSHDDSRGQAIPRAHTLSPSYTVPTEFNALSLAYKMYHTHYHTCLLTHFLSCASTHALAHSNKDTPTHTITRAYKTITWTLSNSRTETHSLLHLSSRPLCLARALTHAHTRTERTAGVASQTRPPSQLGI